MTEQKVGLLSAQVEDETSFAAFLESTPPNQDVVIHDFNTFDSRNTGPEIQIHCPGESCNGMRFFRARERGGISGTNGIHHFILHYICSNCRSHYKSFSIRYTRTDDGNFSCCKLGEEPTYGPPTPARLISMIGQDRDMFLKGRRCENQGLGVGAFVYYRRVVENQKNRILDQIIKVSKKVGAPQDSIEMLETAKTETQFSKSLSSVKNAIPQSLLINGHNPLTLLHAALSDGLHDRTDEHCLEIAQSVRIILAELSERLAQALKDEAELNSAVSRLLNSK